MSIKHAIFARLVIFTSILSARAALGACSEAFNPISFKGNETWPASATYEDELIAEITELTNALDKSFDDLVWFLERKPALEKYLKRSTVLTMVIQRERIDQAIDQAIADRDAEAGARWLRNKDDLLKEFKRVLKIKTGDHETLKLFNSSVQTMNLHVHAAKELLDADGVKGWIEDKLSQPEYASIDASQFHFKSYPESEFDRSIYLTERLFSIEKKASANINENLEALKHLETALFYYRMKQVDAWKLTTDANMASDPDAPQSQLYYRIEGEGVELLNKIEEVQQKSQLSATAEVSQYDVQLLQSRLHVLRVSLSLRDKLARYLMASFNSDEPPF